MPKSSIPVEASLGPATDADITMVDVQPPTQPKAFAVSTAVPPTQPKNFNRPPPTGPRLVPPTTVQPPAPHQPPVQETPPAPTPTQSDPGPAVADAPVVELNVPGFELTGRDKVAKIEKTVGQIQSHVSFSSCFRSLTNLCEKVT